MGGSSSCSSQMLSNTAAAVWWHSRKEKMCSKGTETASESKTQGHLYRQTLPFQLSTFTDMRQQHIQ